MNTLIFQHSPAEIPGTLTQWLAQAGHDYQIHRVFNEGPFPDAARFDWLVVLGGPMNVDEEKKHPWLKAEKRFIADWLKADKALLGICLGGQLLAQALGGRVTKNTAREIGFHDVLRTQAEHPAFARWPERMRVFQYHEDRFSLPAGCETLLTNDICEHQAFAWNQRTVGLQFHPESTEPWIQDALSNLQHFCHEPYVQPVHECAAQMPIHLPALTNQFFAFLEDFTALAKR